MHSGPTSNSAACAINRGVHTTLLTSREVRNGAWTIASRKFGPPRHIVSRNYLPRATPHELRLRLAARAPSDQCHLEGARAALLAVMVEPMTGIEPAYSAWEADVLPLNYIGVRAGETRVGNASKRGQRSTAEARGVCFGWWVAWVLVGLEGWVAVVVVVVVVVVAAAVAVAFGAAAGVFVCGAGAGASWGLMWVWSSKCVRRRWRRVGGR